MHTMVEEDGAEPRDLLDLEWGFSTLTRGSSTRAISEVHDV